ncbi:unnamed protein product, partial [Brassica rapa subsp. narinosa]
MNRFRKKKEPSLMEELKELELLDEGEMVDIPDLEVEDLIEENTLSIIVRCLNPFVHKVGGLVKALPPIWGMEDRTQGRVVGEDRVQFTFRSKNDLKFVLSKGPWFVNGWMVAMDQWTPNPQEDFLKRITFWIRIRGLPIHMLKRQVVETLLDPLGKVETVELHAKNSNSLEYVRALVKINTEEPLQFRRIARFKSGATYPTELEYEKLLKVCYGCKRLTHDQTKCPHQILAVGEGELEGRDRVKESNLRNKLKEKETKAKEILQRPSAKGATKGVIISGPSPSTSQARNSAKGRGNLKEDKSKGKKIASKPRLEWKQKGGKEGPEKTRSTEESTANPRSSGEYSGNKSATVEAGGQGHSPATNASGSVFNRLGGLEEVWGSKRNRGKREEPSSPADLRMKLSGVSSGEKGDGKSSKGSRSPPSVFERLGSQGTITPGFTRSIEDSRTTKKRRLSSSDERNPKKARRNSSEKKKVSPSVFQRLGETRCANEGNNQEEAHHSALVAVTTPVHSA